VTDTFLAAFVRGAGAKRTPANTWRSLTNCQHAALPPSGRRLNGLNRPSGQPIRINANVSTLSGMPRSALNSASILRWLVVMTVPRPSARQAQYDVLDGWVDAGATNSVQVGTLAVIVLAPREIERIARRQVTNNTGASPIWFQRCALLIIIRCDCASVIWAGCFRAL
jgi:hypothetical protein